jgi:hypothetical protein
MPRSAIRVNTAILRKVGRRLLFAVPFLRQPVRAARPWRSFLVNKKNLFLATLLAAIPAALLGAFLVKTFVGNLEGLRHFKSVMTLYAVTLAACAAVVFLPFSVLIFGSKSRKDQPQSGSTDGSSVLRAKPKDHEADASVDDADMGLGDEAPTAAVSTGELEVVEADSAEMENLDESDAVVEGFDETPQGSSADDFLFDDEEPPKKAPPKKKK